MNPILSISIMAHESRLEWLGFLDSMLGFGVPTFIDRGKRGDPENIGVWANCKRAWQAYNPNCKYHVVVQDDAIPCVHFERIAQNVIAQACADYKKMPAISFYYGNRKNHLPAAKAALERGNFVIKDRPIWGVAICLPTYLIPEMIAYCDKLTIPEDDTRIGRFLKHKKIPVYFPIPSLVDHRTGHGSLVGDPGDYRRAAYFIDRI
jgi:hypothetical protein